MAVKHISLGSDHSMGKTHIQYKHTHCHQLDDCTELSLWRHFLICHHSPAPSSVLVFPRRRIRETHQLMAGNTTTNATADGLRGQALRQDQRLLWWGETRHRLVRVKGDGQDLLCFDLGDRWRFERNNFEGSKSDEPCNNSSSFGAYEQQWQGSLAQKLWPMMGYTKEPKKDKLWSSSSSSSSSNHHHHRHLHHHLGDRWKSPLGMH